MGLACIEAALALLPSDASVIVGIEPCAELLRLRVQLLEQGLRLLGGGRALDLLRGLQLLSSTIVD